MSYGKFYELPDELFRWVDESLRLQRAMWLHEILWGIPCGPHPAMVNEKRYEGLKALLEEGKRSGRYSSIMNGMSL